MARVPRFTGRANFRIPSAPTVRSNEADVLEAEGQALQDIANGVAGIAGTLSNYGKARQRINDNLSKNQAVNAAESAGQLADDFARTNPDGSPDGGTMLTDFEDTFQERKTEFIDGIEDETQRAQAELAWDNIGNKFKKNLFIASRERHVEHSRVQSDLIKDGYTTNVFNNSDAFSSNAEALDEHYEILLDNGILQNSTQKEVLQASARQDLATASILGLIEKEEYDTAKEKLLTGELKNEFSLKEKQGLIDQIDNRKIRKTNQSLAEENARINRTKRDLKKSQDIKFNEMVLKSKAAAEPEQAEKINDELDVLVGAQAITPSMAQYVRTQILDKDADFIDDRNHFNLQDRILKDEDLSVIEEEVRRSTNNRQIKPATGRSLLNMINTQKKIRFTDPTAKQRLRDAHGVLNASFGTVQGIEARVDIDGAVRKRMMTLKNDATIFMHRLLEQNPTMDPVDAANRSVLKFTPTAQELPKAVSVPIDLQTTVKGTKEAAEKLKLKLKKGLISKSLYDRDITRLLDIVKRLQIEERIENKTKRNQEGAR